MKLYNANLSPNALRARAVAYELGLDIEIVEIDMRAGEHKSEHFLALNPNGKVPVLVDGDFAVWESRAINVYLAGLKPKAGLYPDDAKTRAIVDQWTYWGAIHLGPAIQRVAFERLFKPMFGMGEADEAAVESGLKETAQLLPILDTALKGKDWIAGDLSLADFALASVFVYREGAGISPDGTPNVAAWLARIESRESWKKAVAPIVAMLKE